MPAHLHVAQVRGRAAFVGTVAFAFFWAAALARADFGGSAIDNIASSQQAGGARNAEMLLVEISVNGQAVPGIVRIDRLSDGRTALSLETWKALRLRTFGEPMALPEGQQGYALESVPELTYKVDRGRMTLALTVPAAAFDASVVSIEDARTSPPNLAPPGVYVNYGFAATQQQGARLTYGGAVQAVVFNRWGSLVAGAAVLGDGHSTTVTRTDTYWRRDWPTSMETLIVGDAIGNAGGWSRPVRFGGVVYARDFALAPGFITYPLPSLSGSAALPSTVDILVNNQRQGTTNVQPGPFDLTNVPVVNGAGEVNLVVRDLRGVETVITQGYYTAPSLLAAGLSDFSAEAGALRLNYGSQDSDYDYRAAFVAGSYRYGFTPAVTAGGRVELQRDRQAAGAEVTGLLGVFAIARVAGAWSRTSEENGAGENRGGRWLAALQRTTPQGGAAVAWEHFGAGFRQFGATFGELRPRDRLMANAGYAFGAAASVGVSYVRQTNWCDVPYTLAGANVGIALPGNAYLSLYASRQVNAGAGWSAGLNVMVPFGNQITATATSNRDPMGKFVDTVQVNSAAPPGPGWGWTVRASDSETQRAQAGATLNTNYGQFVAEANVGKDANAVRLGADGSAGWLEGLPFATRRIEQGAFAVVRVGDLEGVAVSLSNQEMATTNSHGLALVPNLLPYQTNNLTVNPDQLPFDVNIGGVKESVIPYARSGVVVNFPVRRSRNALVTLRQPDGTPVPAGARVIVSPGDGAFVVARRGEVYLTDLADDNSVDVRWKDGACSLPLALAGVKDVELQLGPMVCGSQR